MPLAPNGHALVREVFDTDLMHAMALEILGTTLSDDLLVHAADFYASPIWANVWSKAENTSHMIDDDGLKSEAGRQ